MKVTHSNCNAKTHDILHIFLQSNMSQIINQSQRSFGSYKQFYFACFPVIATQISVWLLYRCWWRTETRMQKLLLLPSYHTLIRET